MSVVYPGIWGCLQPHPPKVAYQTSAVFPFEILDKLNLPQPRLTNESLLKVTFYNPSYKEQLGFGKAMISSGSMVVTIRYVSVSVAEQMTFSKGTIVNGSMVIAINYVTTATADTIRWPQPIILPTSSLTTTINYVNTVSTDTIRWAQPSILPTSSLT
jgi:hypothetical protein